MACGEGAVVSHRSAAEMFGLLPETDRGVEVTVVDATLVPMQGSGFTVREHWPGTT
jgi:hypothetical protein